MSHIYHSVTELIGHTPLIEFSRLAAEHKVKAHLLAKAECFNPASSVKDRIALKMIESIPPERITSETVFVEATSGNTGIGLAAVCAAKGYRLVIIMPENMSKERVKMMRHFGADVVLTPAAEGMAGAVAKAQMLSEKNPNVIVLKQFENEANPKAHTFGTAMELMEDTGGNIDALVCGVGTSGTLTGIAKALKSCNPDLYTVAVEPQESMVLEGHPAGAHKIPGIGANFVPPFYDPNLVSEVMPVPSLEAFQTAQETARTEGLAVGISAGAALWAALRLGRRPEMHAKNIVVILPDGIERYLSLSYFD
jgi:cysteine synthase A